MKIKNIEIRKIHSHPDNPRKDLGDITELSQSIAENGIMQNLTVVEREDGEYTAIIGHRRLAAALKAGLDTVPCAVVKMSEKEQQSTMLCENMQRSDLTVYEQAQGFQMMLDLGSTEDEIAEKTGFSKQTVRHRINLAKLDQKLLKEKNADENFQMTLKDMYELEKIDDVEKRNEILSKVRNSSELAYRVNDYLKNKKREELTEKTFEILKELIPEIKIINPKNAAGYQWVTSIYINTNMTEEELKNDIERKVEDLGDYEEVVVYESYGNIYIKIKEEITAEEQKEKELKDRKFELIEKICDKAKSIQQKTIDFIEDIVLEKVKLNLEEYGLTEINYVSKLWNLILLVEPEMTKEDMIDSLGDLYDARKIEIPEDDEEEFLEREVDKKDIFQQMWLMIKFNFENRTIYYNYDGERNTANADALLMTVDVLTPYGFLIDEEDKEFIKGNDELIEELKKVKEELNG